MITDITTPQKEKRFCKVILKYNGPTMNKQREYKRVQEYASRQLDLI